MTDATSAFTKERAAVIADATVTGRALCQSLTAATDAWLSVQLDAARSGTGCERLALVAVGGYGRRELCPGSDLDVVLLHDGKLTESVARAAEQVWYPVWDLGLKLGHALRTVKTSLALAGTDLQTATGLLSARHIAGDEDLTTELRDGAARQWTGRAARWLGALERSVEARQAVAGDVSFLLEPNLKEGHGGLRDVQALSWADAARPILTQLDQGGLDGAYEALLAARVELHRSSGRAGDVLLLQEQDAVARALGDVDADALMARIARAGRTISWSSDEVWRRVRASMHGGRGRRDRVLNERIVVLDGEIQVRPGAIDSSAPGLALEAAVAAATLETSINQQSLHRLAAAATQVEEPWAGSVRQLFADLLLAGRPAIPVIEALDQHGVWEHYLPEWPAVRCKPQRNAYHRFTVDRHLVEAAVGAAALAGSVDRPDLLVVGALLHDIGKGFPGDHTEVGCDLVRTMAVRMGFVDGDVDDLVAMVEHHLLLPDAASRRDLADPATITAVAHAVGTTRRLHLLAALTEADSLATGPAAWSPWKANLVGLLVGKVGWVLAGATVGEVVQPDPPPVFDLTGAPEERIEVSEHEVTVVCLDHPGTFSRVAGVLALHGLDVRVAQAWSDGGVGASRFQIDAGPRTLDAERVADDIRLALHGRLALEARVAERAVEQSSRRRRFPVGVAPCASITIDNEASQTATVIDVHAPDAIAMLYRLTRALADFDLDLRTALVQTLGPAIADAFYVTDRAGAKILDPIHQAEIEKALLFACTSRADEQPRSK